MAGFNFPEMIRDEILSMGEAEASTLIHNWLQESKHEATAA
jgi:hypothetical protein